MGEVVSEPLPLTVQEAKEAKSIGNTTCGQKRLSWWIRTSLYTIFVLTGQTVATLLGRQYYEKGGNSKWFGTLVQLAGFPILIPFYCFPPLRKPNNTTKHMSGSSDNQKSPPPLMAAGVYVTLGVLVAIGCYLYSIGLMYLRVSTFSLICASQLAFNALFSYLFNSQKFTPFIVNSLILLTLSSTLLVTQGDDGGSTPEAVSKSKYVIGFLCTIGASAEYGFVLSLTQLSFQKVFKKETFTTVMNIIIYQSLVATTLILFGFFYSGEWRHLKTEMEGYELGKTSYVMNIVWTAISWQVFNIGSVGLIFEVSSLFSNAIGVLGLPIVPVLAVVFFGDKMDGTKVISLLLALWGFVSYAYQNYLDDCKELLEKKDLGENSVEESHLV